MQAPERSGIVFFLPAALVIVVCCAWSVAVARQEPPQGGGSTGAPAPQAPAAQGTPPPVNAPREGKSPEGGPAPGSPASPVPPELEASYVVRTYKVRPTKLWKGLLESLQAEGYPPEDLDEEKRTVKTSFVDFKQDDYQLQVTEPPRLFGGDYHILQMIKVRQGKVSLEGVVTATKRGAELKVRARILVNGLDRVNRVRVLVDRRSSGVIEADFIHKFEARLDLEHL